MFGITVFSRLFLIFTLVVVLSVSLPTTKPTDCHNSNELIDHHLEHPILKKRLKRFLYPQLLVLNLNSCGCRNRVVNRYGVGNRYGLGTTYGPLNQLRKARNRKYLVQRKHLLRAQPVRKQKKISFNLSTNKENRNQKNRIKNVQDKRNFGG